MVCSLIRDLDVKASLMASAGRHQKILLAGS